MHEEATTSMNGVPNSAPASTSQTTDIASGPTTANNSTTIVDADPIATDNSTTSEHIELLVSYSSNSGGGGSMSGMEMGGNSGSGGYPMVSQGSDVGNGGSGTAGGSSVGAGDGSNSEDTKYGIASVGQIPGGGGGVGGGGAGLGDPPDTKYGFEELCPVCGDKVSGYHYGLLTCESCKGFFKRTVQNKKVYTCVAERSCHIDKTQRKRCPFCRFQKCLTVGMKLEAVRADRMRGGRNKFGPMYKRDRARKLQIMRQRQLAVQALRGSCGEGGLPMGYNSSPGSSPFTNLHIKQEIQIPQVSSLTSSPDSSPSPIAVAHGQVPVGGNGGNGGGGGSVQVPTLQLASYAGTSGSAGGMVLGGAGGESKLWGNANSATTTTTTSPHSLSPKGFTFDGTTVAGASNASGGTGALNPNTTSTSSSSNGAGGPPAYKISPLIREFVNAVDDREWQNSLYSLLQNQTYNQCEVDLFELMCKVLDQNLFTQVDWARNSIFFKDLKVDEQMKLLQHSWSDMLVLDHMHQRMHNNLPDEMILPNGQKFDLLCLGLLGVPSLADVFNDLTAKLQELKFDIADYICIKFLLLLNPDNVRGMTNRKHVQEGYDQVQIALQEYTLKCYPEIQDKFMKLLMVLPEIHAMASRGEEHLYLKHCNGSAPTATLLMEMLHAKRK